MINVRDFSQIVSCTRCTSDGCLLWDREENVPQPGYVGSNYPKYRVAVVGQNPAVPSPRLLAKDREYTAALREIVQRPDGTSMEAFSGVFEAFAPLWPVQQYLPLAAAGLQLDDIAYFNLVRCRTKGRGPSEQMARNCMAHFEGWIEALAPRLVVFIGKWPHDRATVSLTARGIAHDYISRQKSLYRQERAANLDRIVRRIHAALS